MYDLYNVINISFDVSHALVVRYYNKMFKTFVMQKGAPTQ